MRLAIREYMVMFSMQRTRLRLVDWRQISQAPRRKVYRKLYGKKSVAGRHALHGLENSNAYKNQTEA
jgi:hypothetical protein